MQQASLKNQSLTEILIRESINIPFGWKEEVYYDKETDEITFSSPMTQNSWTQNENKVGDLESYDAEEGTKIINSDWVEIDITDDGIDPDFDLKDYEMYYKDGSIISMDEAISRWAEWGEDNDWYSDIRENINVLKNGEVII